MEYFSEYCLKRSDPSAICDSCKSREDLRKIYRAIKSFIEWCNSNSNFGILLATIALAIFTWLYLKEASKLVSLSQDPTIYVSSPDNTPLLRLDSAGKYPVLLTNSSHTGVKDVRFHYRQMAAQGISGNRILFKSGTMLSDKDYIKNINTGESVPFKLNLNSNTLNKAKFEFDPDSIHIEFFYVRITYRREIDNKLFSIEKAYFISNIDKNNKTLAEVEWIDLFTPSEGVQQGVTELIKMIQNLPK